MRSIDESGDLHAEAIEGGLHRCPAVREDGERAEAADMGKQDVQHMMHVLDAERVLVVVKFVNVGADHRSDGTAVSGQRTRTKKKGS